MKKLLIILFIISLKTFAQNQQQGIELPDFVITGKQNVDVELAQKPKIELISILSKDFIMPKYSSEELPLFFVSNPEQLLPSLKLSQDYFSGKINFMIGKYTYPLGELNLSKGFDNYLFNLNLWGTNIKEYIQYAGYNNSGIQINNDIYVSTKSNFLPGTTIKLDASYIRDSYNFYASTIPNEKRETNNFIAKFSLHNNYINYFHFGFDLIGDIYRINNKDFKETKINSNLFAEFYYDNFFLGSKINFNRISDYDNISNSRNYNFLNTKTFLKITPFDFLKVEGGINYNTNNRFNFFSPYAFAELKFDKNISLSAKFNPHVEEMTIKDFITKNLFSITNIDNSYIKYKNDLTLDFKYEYQKFFSISWLTNYSKIDNYVYFEDIKGIRKFDVLTQNNISKLLSKISLNLFNKEYGYFFGEFIYQSIKNGNNKSIPFEPNLISNLSYTYNFNFGLAIYIGYQFNGEYYSEITNQIKNESFSNLSFGTSYEMFNGLKIKIDFQNILNKSNFVWQHYKDKPFDYIFGIEYRW